MRVLNSICRSLRKSYSFNAVRIAPLSCSYYMTRTCLLHLQRNSVRKNFLNKYEKVKYARHYSDYPSHIRVNLPALSPTMEMGSIVSWSKKEGDRLNEGDLLAEIETDKATMAFETPEEGYLAKILMPAGSRDVPIGKLVCIIVEEESDIAAFKDFKDEGAAQMIKTSSSTPTQSTTSPQQTTPSPSVSVSTTQPSTEKGRVYASPMAKRLAEVKKIRLESIGKGSGMFDSIRSKDLEGAPVETSFTAAPISAPTYIPISTPPPPGTKFTDEPVSSIRAVIAKRLVQSKQTIPHFYLTMDICVDEMLQVRTVLNKELGGLGVRLSVNDFIIKATAQACKKVPDANSAWMDTIIRKYHTVDVSVAVSTRRGLITPIIVNAGAKTVREISTEMKHLALKAREGKLQPHEFQGGTISVSNLGMYGTTHFSAIINPPQSCILAVGALQERLVPKKSKPGGIGTSQFIAVTLSCDHRSVDGAVGAEWLAAFRQIIESPQQLYE